MATGRPAFTGATAPVVAAALLHEQPPAPSTLRPELTVRFDEIVLKALEKDRTLRYAQASDLRADLLRLKRDTDGSATAAAGRAALAPARRGILWLTAGALLAIAAIGGGYLYSLYSRRPAPLTDKETVVLADFANTTGDSVFDDTLRQGLAIQLQQSTFLSLASDTRIQQLLGLMGQPAGASSLRPSPVISASGSAAAPSSTAASPASALNTSSAFAPRDAAAARCSARNRSRSRGRKTC